MTFRLSLSVLNPQDQSGSFELVADKKVAVVYFGGGSGYMSVTNKSSVSVIMSSRRYAINIGAIIETIGGGNDIAIIINHQPNVNSYNAGYANGATLYVSDSNGSSQLWVGNITTGYTQVAETGIVSVQPQIDDPVSKLISKFCPDCKKCDTSSAATQLSWIYMFVLVIIGIIIGAITGVVFTKIVKRRQ